MSQPPIDRFVRAMVDRFGDDAAGIALGQAQTAVPEVAASWTLIAARIADLVSLQSTNEGMADVAEPDDA